MSATSLPPGNISPTAQTSVFKAFLPKSETVGPSEFEKLVQGDSPNPASPKRTAERPVSSASPQSDSSSLSSVAAGETRAAPPMPPPAPDWVRTAPPPPPLAAKDEPPVAQTARGFPVKGYQYLYTKLEKIPKDPQVSNRLDLVAARSKLEDLLVEPEPKDFTLFNQERHHFLYSHLENSTKAFFQLVDKEFSERLRKANYDELESIYYAAREELRPFLWHMTQTEQEKFIDTELEKTLIAYQALRKESDVLRQKIEDPHATIDAKDLNKLLRMLPTMPPGYSSQSNKKLFINAEWQAKLLIKLAEQDLANELEQLKSQDDNAIITYFLITYGDNYRKEDLEALLNSPYRMPFLRIYITAFIIHSYIVKLKEDHKGKESELALINEASLWKEIMLKVVTAANNQLGKPIFELEMLPLLHNEAPKLPILININYWIKNKI